MSSQILKTKWQYIYFRIYFPPQIHLADKRMDLNAS